MVGIGIDTDWAASDFPPELATTMTSLRAASAGRRIDHAALLAGFLARLEARTEALRGGRFDVADWTDRQLTNGRVVEFVTADGSTRLVKALGVDVRSGALIVDDPDDPSRGAVVARRRDRPRAPGRRPGRRLGACPAGRGVTRWLDRH